MSIRVDLACCFWWKQGWTDPGVGGGTTAEKRARYVSLANHVLARNDLPAAEAAEIHASAARVKTGFGG